MRRFCLTTGRPSRRQNRQPADLPTDRPTIRLATNITRLSMHHSPFIMYELCSYQLHAYKVNSPDPYTYRCMCIAVITKARQGYYNKC